MKHPMDLSALVDLDGKEHDAIEEEEQLFVQSMVIYVKMVGCASLGYRVPLSTKAHNVNAQMDGEA